MTPAIDAHDIRRFPSPAAAGFSLPLLATIDFQDFMTARLQNSEAATAGKTAQSPINSAESSMIAEHAEDMPLNPCDANRRRLRNRLLLANAVAWFVIIIVIRLVFF